MVGSELITIQETGITEQADLNQEAVLNGFMESLDVFPKTKENYRAGVKHYLDWLKDNNRSGTERADILAYKGYLQTVLKPSSISTYITAVRVFYKYLQGQKIFPDIAQGIRGGKAVHGFRKDSFTINQVKTILGAMKKGTLEEKRNYAIVNCLFRTGTRLIELARANVSDIRFSGNAITLAIQGKGRTEKDEVVVLTESTYSAIQDYLNARGKVSEDAPLFASHSNRNLGGRMTTQMLGKIARDSFRAVGINSERLTPHSTRHTAITFLLMNNGGNLAEAKELSRHASLNTLSFYAHSLNRVENAPEKKIDSLLDGF